MEWISVAEILFNLNRYPSKMIFHSATSAASDVGGKLQVSLHLEYRATYEPATVHVAYER